MLERLGIFSREPAISAGWCEGPPPIDRGPDMIFPPYSGGPIRDDACLLVLFWQECLGNLWL